VSAPIVGASVTIGLVSGTTRTGRLGKFLPSMLEVPLEADPASRRPRELVPAELVAYVAFHRAPDVPPPTCAEGAQRYRIYVAGGAMFRVETAAAASTSGLGFTATPSDADSPFSEIFFYRHGVSAREKDIPIGSMLVHEGVVKPEQLENAIDVQRQEKQVPIGQILIEHRKVNANEVAQAALIQQRKHLRIGEVLVDAGLVKAEDIEAALAEQKQRRGKRLGEMLVDMKLISELTLANVLAKKFEIPFVDLDACALNPMAAIDVPRELIAKYRILPVDSDSKSLTVAISDPLALEAIDVFRFHAKRRIDEVLVTAGQLGRYVDAFLSSPAAGAREAPGDITALIERLKTVDSAGELIEDDIDTESSEPPSDSTIVTLVNQIIVDGYRRGASDIHVEPNGQERPIRIRFRVDGDCFTAYQVPPQHRSSVVARIKIMAKLDIAERRKPQDGKIRFRLSDGQIELRVATLPTANGNEDVVLRILANSKPLPLHQLRLSERNLSELERLIQQPNGLILCVGPTGSGKTTTLHSALGAINDDDTKIWTAEDPIEISQFGLRQVQVNPKIGFTFAQAMRAFLRADPDVIMIGEMRDPETANTAIEASLTGHLVLSTLHTNSAPETITRLLDMGLDPFSFADAMLGVLAQRLARTLCSKCKVSEACAREEYDQLVRAYGPEHFAQDFPGQDFGPGFRLSKPVGCEACGKSGYKGRLGIHELLVATDPLRNAIAEKSPVEKIRRLAVEGGMRTLLQDGIAKVMFGLTDMKQVLAVCSR
jgi:type II secretory ATPase GspE/PulE/Tfp pilus assembly ATPase PilB-like protein